jgi:hypothetical protein
MLLTHDVNNTLSVLLIFHIFKKMATYDKLVFNIHFLSFFNYN